MKDTYQTIEAPSEGEFRDRGSKFFAFAFPTFTEPEWQDALEEVRKSHPKARHYCYAWRLGLDGNSFRANDDGEPSGTAGRPILGQIDSFELTNVFIVVVRYFGGTLLGTSGLINAYREAAADALRHATIIARTVEEVYEMHFDYSLMSQVMNAVKKLDLEMVEQDFGNEARLQVAIRQGELSDTLLQLKARIGGLRLEEVNEQTVIAGLKMKPVYSR